MQWIAEFTQSLQQLLPRLVAAAALLVAGLILAFLLRFLSVRLSKRLLEHTRRHAGVTAAVEEAEMRSAVPRIVGGAVYWGTLLLFAAAAIESLAFTVVSRVLSQMAYYLPNVLAAILIVIVGMVVGKLARRAAVAGARSAGIAHSDGVGQAIQAGVLLVAGVVALDQIGIDAQLLVILVTVVVAAALASAGLAFGIGANTTVSNIVAAYYVSQNYAVGQRVRIGDIEGEIVQLTPTAVMLTVQEGRMLIPAKRFNEEASILVIGGA